MTERRPEVSEGEGRPSDFDVPEADALEQHREADDERAASEDELRRVRIAPDVPEADALEQAREAELDDEDYT